MLLNTGGKMDRYPFQQQWTLPNPGSLSLLCQSAVIYSSGKPFSLVRFCLCGAGTGCISPAPASQTLLVGPRLPTASLRELYCSSSTATLTDILALFSSLLVQQVTLCERTKCVLKAAWGEGEGGGGDTTPKRKGRELRKCGEMHVVFQSKRALALIWNSHHIPRHFLHFFLEALTFLEQLSHPQQSTIYHSRNAKQRP